MTLTMYSDLDMMENGHIKYQASSFIQRSKMRLAFVVLYEANETPGCWIRQ